jgi:hypothetical protein
MIQRRDKSYVFISRCLSFFLFVFWACPLFSADVTIAWDANREPDVSGYYIYFRKGSEGPPYDLLRYIGLQEIDPGNPSVVVTGLEDDAVYYFTVTALDTEDYESGYSNSACGQIAGGTIRPCSAEPDGGSGGSSTSAGSGGGGGGGCFIGSLRAD